MNNLIVALNNINYQLTTFLLLLGINASLLLLLLLGPRRFGQRKLIALTVYFGGSMISTLLLSLVATFQWQTTSHFLLLNIVFLASSLLVAVADELQKNTFRVAFYYSLTTCLFLLFFEETQIRLTLAGVHLITVVTILFNLQIRELKRGIHLSTFIYLFSYVSSFISGFLMTGISPWQPRTITPLLGMLLLGNILYMLATVLDMLITEASFFKESSNKDPMTKLLNRRGMDTELERIFLQQTAPTIPFSIVAIDIDHFKKINDEYSHDVGDNVIQLMAKLISQECRHDEIIVRLGGEEFAVFLPRVALNRAADIAENIRRRIESTPYQNNDQSISFTASFGVASYTLALNQHNLHYEVPALLKCADKMLYEAKSKGRNQVCRCENYSSVS